MPYPIFDRSKLKLLPLAERTHDVDISIMMDPSSQPPTFQHEALEPLAEKMLIAKKAKSTILLMYGAHVIRTGNALYMIELMKQGLVTHFATNGAGGIHDFELALIGKTCESVAKYISEGQFGLWKETGIINDIAKQAIKDKIGLGEAIGRYIWENNLPYRDKSVLAVAYHLGIPATIHVGIGNDIIHEHPNCDGAALGESSYTDFLIYTQSITNLEKGVFLNFGSAVTGPEIYLKALAMARNVAHQKGQKITDFTTAVFDIQPIEGKNFHKTPTKDSPQYYFRPWKTILARTVADGGTSYYIQGEHQKTLPNLASVVLNKNDPNWRNKIGK